MVTRWEVVDKATGTLLLDGIDVKAGERTAKAMANFTAKPVVLSYGTVRQTFEPKRS